MEEWQVEVDLDEKDVFLSCHIKSKIYTTQQASLVELRERSVFEFYSLLAVKNYCRLESQENYVYKLELRLRISKFECRI